MGGPTIPSAQPESKVLQAYTQYLPGVLNATAGTNTNTALSQLAATQATQPGYNALNLQQGQQFALPLAQLGQQVTNSNALAGAQTNLNQIQGAGGQAAQAAYDLARKTNPNYYGVQDASSKAAANLLGSINLNGLSPGESNAVERANNQSLSQSGNLGNLNATNTISNALNFGGAFNQKLGLMNQAIGTANQTATSAQNTGFNPVSLALGQPNTSTMGNFGTGTYSPTNTGTGAGTTGNTFGFGQSVLGGMNSANNSLIGANAQLASAYTPSALMGSMPSYS